MSTATLKTPRTCKRDGGQIYVSTGRPVDENLGSHVVLWIVEDPEAWATAIEAEGDAQVSQWSRAQRHIGEGRREQAYASAAKVRSEGARRTIYAHHYDGTSADATAADLHRAHPNPGVRYEVAAIADTRPCFECHQPTIFAGGQWWHHLGGYPTECVRRPDPQPESELPDGDFEINTAVGSMICGYCGQGTAWSEAALGYARLTGFHMLGIELSTNELVVLAEATTLAGVTVGLPHHCAEIPEDLHRHYAPTATLRR